jgi:hypothetical protein
VISDRLAQDHYYSLNYYVQCRYLDMVSESDSYYFSFFFWKMSVKREYPIEEGGWEMICPDAELFEFELTPEISAMFVKPPAADASAGFLAHYRKVSSTNISLCIRN